MYTENSIDNVRSADIVRVIGNFITLKKAGSVFQAKSPFGEEKTASFTVFPKNNNFKDFSTGKSGDAIGFVMEYKGVRFGEAVKIVAEICGIALEEEVLSEEAQRKKSYRQDLYDIMRYAATRYSMQYSKLVAEHWAKAMIATRGFDDETLTAFGIGYAPKIYEFVTKPLIDKGKLEMAITVGLTNTKEGRSYDFFTDRLLFPIHDFRGNIVGFGGRKSDTAEGPKYINTKETDIYNKSGLLYGLYQNRESIMKSKTAVLVEGYTDVAGLYQNGCQLAVAACGTAVLSEYQCKLLHRYADHVIICMDNDGYDSEGNMQKGMLSAFKNINVLLAEGFRVSITILPEGEDPDSFSRKTPGIQKYIFDNAENAINWKTLKLYGTAAGDPDNVSKMVDEVAEMLYAIKDDIKQGEYLQICRKLIKKPVQLLKDKLKQFVEVAESKTVQTGNVALAQSETLGLPEGAEYRQFFEKGYVSHGCNVYFRGREKFFKGTNFKITPLFHVYGKLDNKRLCEVISETGKKKLIDFDTSDFVQMAKFEAKLLDEGNFTFTQDVTANQFKLLRNDVLSSFIMAYELKTLGWQQERFLAFSNGIYHEGIIKEPNDYGIIQLETGITNDSEYMEDVKHFYSPSSSVMYKFSRDGDDPYENDRYFVYRKAPVTISEWMDQMKKVYGKKAVTGIAFCFATLFRDIYIKRYQFFPHLFLTGEKGSGKSKYAESLVSIFTFKQEAFDLNSGTPVAFYRRLSRICNAPTMLEEYHDGVDDKIFQPIKGAYDGRGREMGKATGDNRTTTTKVLCSIILLSQYLSARDDNSLTSRSVVEHFIKPVESFTTEQIENYSLLKSWEEQGMSSFLCDIMKYRDLVEDKIFTVYGELSKQMKHDLKGCDYQERMLQNYLALLVPVKILRPHFHFPFTEAKIWNQFRDAILDSSDLIVESEGLAEFWRTLEFLLDTHRIKRDYQFIIETPLSVNIQGRKGEAPTELKNTNKDQYLFLRLNAVHQLYHKEVSTREGVEVIGENTLKNYFRSKRYFIGSVKSKRFEDTSTSAYVFNYTQMHESNILNLTREVKTGNDPSVASKAEDIQDDLPF